MTRAPTSTRSAAPPLFGRDEALSEVDELLARAAGSAGGGLLLVGADGIGKSHLLRATAERARARGFRVRTGRALPEELPTPFSLVRDLLDAPPDDDRRTGASPGNGDSIAALLAPLAVPVAVPERGRTDPGSSDELERLLAPLGNTVVEGLGASREELLGRLEDRFRELARRGPLLLAVDDLDLADASSLEFLKRLATALPETSLALIATLGPRPRVPSGTATAVEALVGTASLRSVTLGPLSVVEVTELVRSILGGADPDPQEVLRWHAETEGNPLFVEQVVRAATGYGPTAASDPATGPQTLTEVLVGRVRALGETERRLLTYAAVLGREFRFATLAAVSGMGEEKVTEHLDRLVRSGLVREKEDEVYEFLSEAVRSEVYTSLTETRRRILHQKIGRALAATPGTSDAELARQFYLGRDDARAVEYNLRAAQSATRAFAFETAAAHLARALEAQRRHHPPDRRAEVRLLTELGRLWDEVGDLPRSEGVLGEALDLARGESGLDLEVGRALLGLAQTRCDKSDYDGAEALVTEASALLVQVGTPRDRLAAHRVAGVVFWRRGDLERAEHHQRAALEIAEEEGTPLERGHALVDVANTMVPAGRARFEPALALYARAAELFRTVGDHGARARVLMNRAVLEYGAGRTEEAFRDLATAIDAAERSRSPIWIGYCQLNFAQWHAELGRPAIARPALERAAQVLAPTGDRLSEQQVAMTRGMIAEADGALDVAEERYEEALALAREMRMASELCEMLFRMAQLAHERGDDPEARARLGEARAAGLVDHRPDFAPRLAALEKALEPVP